MQHPQGEGDAPPPNNDGRKQPVDANDKEEGQTEDNTDNNTHQNNDQA